MKISTKTEWRSTNVQGLYEYRPKGTAENARGVYYSRYSLNGKRTFRSLETSIFEHAKIKHAKRGVDVEKDRQRGADLGGEFKTLGALLAEIERRMAETRVDDDTVIGRSGNIARLKKHWQRGAFDTFLARNCTVDVISELREHLLYRAEWRRKFETKLHRGYRPVVVNQTLWVLRVMLELAVEKMTIIENPFALSTTLRGSLFAKGRTGGAKPQLPSRPEMARLFDEMRRLPEHPNYTPNPEQRQWLLANAEEMADHAELLAYSGMRRDEATRSTLDDDRGDEFKIWGTKSETSDRCIPVNPALRAVLDRIKGRRVGGKTKLVKFAEPRTALHRACDRLGLRRLRNHDLRHYFASVCIASGVDIPTVSRWLGHADGGALAMRTYGHLLKDHSQAAAQKVDFKLVARSA